MVKLICKIVLEFFEKINIESPYAPAILLLLDTYSKESKIGIQVNACIQVFIAALFTVTKRWKQSRGPSKDI